MSLNFQFITKSEVCHLARISQSTLKKIRLAPNSPLVQGLHYERINARTILYRQALIEHWANHRHELIVHLAWCDRIAPQLEAHKQGRLV